MGKRGHWAEAESLYQRMIRLGGFHSRHWVQFGNVLKEQGAFAAAAGAFRTALEAEPEHVIATSSLRHCLRKIDAAEEGRLRKNG